jgi:hypothetical protein
MVKVELRLDYLRGQDDVEICELLSAPLIINDLREHWPMDALGKRVGDICFLRVDHSNLN